MGLKPRAETDMGVSHSPTRTHTNAHAPTRTYALKNAHTHSLTQGTESVAQRLHIHLLLFEAMSHLAMARPGVWGPGVPMSLASRFDGIRQEADDRRAPLLKARLRAMLTSAAHGTPSGGKRERGKSREPRHTRRSRELSKEKVHSKPNTQHPTPNTQHPTPNTRHPTPNTQHPTPNTHGPLRRDIHGHRTPGRTRRRIRRGRL